MATIHTPVPGYNGTVVGVTFEDGVGETDDEGALAYFAAAGYQIDGADGFAIESDEEKPPPLLGQVFENVDSGPRRGGGFSSSDSIANPSAPSIWYPAAAK